MVFRNSRLFVYIDYFRTTLFKCFLISLALFLRSRAMTVVSVTFSLNCAVETDLRPVYSDTTQLNSTELSSTAWTTVNSVCRLWRHKQNHDWLGCIRCSTGSVKFSRVELSCVAINNPLRVNTAEAQWRLLVPWESKKHIFALFPTPLIIAI